VTDVVLLESLVGSGTEIQVRRACCLKLRKREDDVVIIEIVIKAEVLLIINPVIDLYSKLVARSGFYRVVTSALLLLAGVAHTGAGRRRSHPGSLGG